VIAHTAKGNSSYHFGYAESFEDTNSGGHDPLTTGFLSRKVSTLEQFYIDSLSTQQDRQRGPRDSATNNKNIHFHFI
jgi:hypothetical protein